LKNIKDVISCEAIEAPLIEPSNNIIIQNHSKSLKYHSQII